MLRQIIVAATIVLNTAAAEAGSSIDYADGSAKPNSVSYIGYDSFDADGNPICTPCLVQKAKEAARLKAYAERRQRSREYMARLQGNGTQPGSVMAANASPVVQPGQPAPAKVIADVGETPLRAGVQ
ncbi:hypothetical protein [Phyllobacterium endophyticum]|uniref:Uncharacterized protein n=1 Tax=Phyllobacterium endophyticum TaxID=1149773 RepID=A0A2P7B1H9_9HYPH|nr:hypothetical protein [Phyllobacterium endophyticum]MBB3237894.1 hypothetical protein [Phyllobacterium endophyticum]PSH60326.1 hypothetical protein CU100_06460 [Phyllobacterium endophyticum]TYR42500.1 hypothetical protein FY050_15005 [Phyllobacterium endophyticum]